MVTAEPARVRLSVARDLSVAREVFKRSLEAFSAESTPENFRRYRLASGALDELRRRARAGAAR
jgi:hypothetical protein